MKDYSSNLMKLNRKDRRSNKNVKLDLIKELMTACRAHGRIECQHDFNVTRSREEVDRIVVDIPTKEEVQKHEWDIAKIYDKIVKNI